MQEETDNPSWHFFLTLVEFLLVHDMLCLMKQLVGRRFPDLVWRMFPDLVARRFPDAGTRQASLQEFLAMLHMRIYH